MNYYNIGDTVICTQVGPYSSGITVGKEYTIYYVERFDIGITNDHGDKGPYSCYQFQPLGKTIEREVESEVPVAEQAAIAEIYFESLLEKLTPIQKIEAARMIMTKFDNTNPLLRALSPPEPINKIDFDFRTSSAAKYPIESRAHNMRMVTLSGELYALKTARPIAAKLAFVKAFKDMTGLGLKESKDAIDICPSIFVYNMDYGQACLMRDVLFKETGEVIEIGMI